MAVDLSPFVPGMADNPLPQIILNTIIRTAALMLIAWSLLWWDRKTDPKKVFLLGAGCGIRGGDGGFCTFHYCSSDPIGCNF